MDQALVFAEPNLEQTPFIIESKHSREHDFDISNPQKLLIVKLLIEDKLEQEWKTHMETDFKFTQIRH